jgi:hypothetical protein
VTFLVLEIPKTVEILIAIACCLIALIDICFNPVIPIEEVNEIVVKKTTTTTTVQKNQQVQ